MLVPVGESITAVVKTIFVGCHDFPTAVRRRNEAVVHINERYYGGCERTYNLESDLFSFLPQIHNPDYRFGALGLNIWIAIDLNFTTYAWASLEHMITDSRSEVLWAVPFVTTIVSGCYEFTKFKNRMQGEEL